MRRSSAFDGLDCRGMTGASFSAHLKRDSKEDLEGVFGARISSRPQSVSTEHSRDAYGELGPQLTEDPLKEQVFVRVLQKLKRGNSCGPDGIPGEVFTHYIV